MLKHNQSKTKRIFKLVTHLIVIFPNEIKFTFDIVGRTGGILKFSKYFQVPISNKSFQSFKHGRVTSNSY